MIRTTIYLEKEKAVAIRQLAKTTGRPQAELIREALDEYLRDTEHSMPKGVGEYRSGRTDVSEKAEDILGDAAQEGEWP